MFWFGLPAHETSPATWGARAIDDSRTFDLVPDRQSFHGEDDHVNALLTVLNDLGLLAKARAAWDALKAAGEVSPREAKLVTLYEDWFVVVEANTNGSCGYVNLRAYFKPEGYTSKRLRGYPEGGPDAIKPGTAVWSNDDLPAVGEVIYATGAGWASKDGRMEVLGYAVEHGHLHVVGRLLSPTEKWKDQAADIEKRSGHAAYFNVMGREWKRFTTEAQGYLAIADKAEVERVNAIEDRDVRRSTFRKLMQTKSERHAHVREVYMVLLRDGQEAALVDRQYQSVGTMADAEAREFIARSVVTNTWEGYSLTQYPHLGQGMAVWVACPGSPDADHSEARPGSEALAAL